MKIDKSNPKPFYEQIILGIKEDILHGILQPGDKLPSVREMANQLMMNPNTVSKAYKQLENQEVLITVHGKGTFVKKIDRSYRDERQITKIKEKIEELVIEATYLNVDSDEIITWIQNVTKNLGG